MLIQSFETENETNHMPKKQLLRRNILYIDNSNLILVVQLEWEKVLTYDDYYSTPYRIKSLGKFKNSSTVLFTDWLHLESCSKRYRGSEQGFSQHSVVNQRMSRKEAIKKGRMNGPQRYRNQTCRFAVSCPFYAAGQKTEEMMNSCGLC